MYLKDCFLDSYCSVTSVLNEHYDNDGAKHEQFQERDEYREQMLAAIDAFIPGSE